MATVSDRLSLLKSSIHEREPPNILFQCRIVHEALSPGAPFMENVEGLAIYLGVSEGKVSQMRKIHTSLVDEAKEYFGGSTYSVFTAYRVASMTPGEQKAWVKAKSFST